MATSDYKSAYSEKIRAKKAVLGMPYYCQYHVCDAAYVIFE